MSDTSASVNRVSGGEFRIGRIFSRTISIYTRNFLIFSLVELVAFAPSLVLSFSEGNNFPSQSAGGRSSFSATPISTADFATGLLSAVLWLFSQAVLVYGTFQDMRSRRVSLYESVNASLIRFFPILGLVIFIVLGIGSIFVILVLVTAAGATSLSSAGDATITLILPIAMIAVVAFILMLITRWFIAIPICMVEQLGPWRSLIRSAQLTKGHRWKVFGIVLVLYLGASIIGAVIGITIGAVGGRIAGLFASLILNVILGAFFAIYVVVTYYELRSAKDGVDVDQIASVFD